MYTATELSEKKNKLVPQLRFKGFRDEYPLKQLDAIVNKKISYGIVQAGEHIENGMPYIKSQNLNNEINISELQRTSDEIAKKYQRSEVKPGDIVFSLRGNIGVSRIVPSSIEVANLTQGTARISVSNLFCNRFVYFSLQINFIIKQILEVSKGSTFQEISLESLRKIKIPTPTLAEQTKIANFLTEVDKKLTALKQKKSLLEQYKKGVMQQIFSQELRFKYDNGNDFPDWEEKKLGEVCDVRDGTHDSPKYVQKGFPFITSKNLMKDGSIDLGNVSFITEIDYHKVNQRSKVDINDILFGMIGTIGNPVLVKSNGFAIKNVALIKERVELLNLFLIHFLKGDSINQQFFEQNTGGTQKFLSLSIIRNLIIGVPSTPEQTKIANFLTAIDEKIDHCQGQIEKTQVWKKGLLQQMFV